VSVAIASQRDDRSVSKQFNSSGVQAAPDSFINQFTIQHGPLGLLGRFFLAADAECRRRGITLSIGTCSDLVEANQANRDSWKPMMPIFDPAFHAFTPDNSVVFIGRNSAGKIVATQAALLFDLEGTTYHDYAAALKINYADPASMKRDGEVCRPTAPTLKTMTGRVSFSGGLWYHPSVRGLGLAAITPRLTRAWGYAMWRANYATAFIVEGPLKAGLGTNAGYTKSEWGITFENSPMGTFSSALCWMEPDEMLADLGGWLATLQPEVEARRGDGRA
jgi:hypothetical protein